jgi:hypothetical protein
MRDSRRSTGPCPHRTARDYRVHVASFRRDIHIAQPPDVVWAFLGNPARLHEWFPITDCRVEGTKRWITLGSGVTFEEDILIVDDDARRFQYSIVNNFLIKDHFGTLDVLDDGHGGSVVTYQTQCTPNVLALVTAGASGQGLQKAKRILEGAR